MHRFKEISLLLFLIIVLGLGTAGHCGTDQFVIGTDPWPPFTVTKNGRFSGIDVDLCKEIEKRVPIKIRFKEIPWTRALHFMKTGRIDAITGLAKRREREAYVLYTSPPYYSKCSSVFYLRSGQAGRVTTYEDLYRFKIGFVVNSAYFHPFDTDEKLNKHSVTHESQLLKMLDLGYLDIIIGTNCQVDYEIKISGFAGRFEKARYQPDNAVDLYMGLSRKSPITCFLPQLNQAIQDLKEEGVIDRIAHNYFH